MAPNDDSTHPNPFRNPMPYNLTWGFYYFDRIYKGLPDSIHDKDWSMKPRDNIMLSQPLSWRLYLAAKKGFVICKKKLTLQYVKLCIFICNMYLASFMGVADIMVNRPLATPKQKLGRYFHFTLPITTSFVSYVAARDFLGVVSEKNGGKFEDDWTFFLAMSAPGAIIGSWCKF